MADSVLETSSASSLLLRTTAVLEGGTALALLVVPAAPIRLLLGESHGTDLALLVARLAGAALLSLAMACGLIGDRRYRRAAPALLLSLAVYDVLAAGVLVYARFAMSSKGVLLWPAVALHAALAVCSVAAAARPSPRDHGLHD